MQKKFSKLKNFSKLFTLRLSKKRNDRILAVFLIFIWAIIILGSFFLRGIQIFEGNITASQMNFTYAGNKEKTFLSKIDMVKKLDIKGSESKQLSLQGSFSSSNPSFNQRLRRLNELVVALPYPTSRLIFSTENLLKPSQLSIIELLVSPESQVKQLTYSSKPSQLSFCLQKQTDIPEACGSPEILPKNSASIDSKSIGKLKIQLGKQKLSVNLKNVNIPALQLRADSGSSENQSFQFIPSNNELILEIKSPSQLFIDLFENKKVKVTKDWFWKNIDVNDVNFSKQERTSKGDEIVESSTILEGKVRLRAQTLEIQPDQFFIVLPEKSLLPFGEKPEIKRLRYIKVSDRSPQGLRASFFGKGTGIAAGLYPESPVQIIEPALLSQYLSQEAINAILGFITAFTAILLPRLFPEPPK